MYKYNLHGLLFVTGDDLMLLVDNVSQCIANQNFEESLFLNIVTMSSSLKMYGQQLESVYKGKIVKYLLLIYFFSKHL